MSAPTNRIPGVYRRRTGEIAVTAPGDACLDGDLSVLQGIDPAPGRSRKAAAGSLSVAWRPSIRPFGPTRDEDI